MKFAIIVPTYNRARVLPRAIRSVLEQDYTDWALYVVNDGSGDETESVVAPFLSDPRIQFLNSNVNRGRLRAINVALDRIEVDGGDWFTWMDDDDQLTSDCLSVARREIERNPEFGMFLFSTVVTTHPCYQRHARRERSEWPPTGCSPGSPWTADSLRFGNRLRRTCGCGSILRLSA